MDLKGIFSPNNISNPVWKNKKGENEFDKMLDKLVGIGKKITEMKKKADTVKLPDGSGATTITVPDSPSATPKEQPVSPASYYDSTPRPLSEVFNKRSEMADKAIYKAKELVGQQLAKLNVPSSDIYLLKTDISRYAGDGTPSTGRISFQIPFLTPQGDQRTIYADVDIVLGGLMPPQQFTDGLNTLYAFSEDGVNQFLRGRDFEIMQNPKVSPETVFFEAPGHLAGRGGHMITRQGEAPEKMKVAPGTDLAHVLGDLDALEKELEKHQKELTEATKELEKRLVDLPEAEKVRGAETEIRKIKKQEKELIAKISSVFDAFQAKTIEYQDVLWKIEKKVDISKTPTYTAVMGKLIEKIKSAVPTIKSIVDELWMNTKTMTETKVLVEESPAGMKEWEIEKKVEKPESTYIPPTEEKMGKTKGTVKKASMSEDVQKVFSLFADIDRTIEETKRELGIK